VRRTDLTSSPRLLIIAAAFALGSCGGEAPEPASEEQVEQEPAARSTAPGVRQVGPNRFEVMLQAFEGGYRPSEIRIPAGAEVTFRATSEDLPHGFSIEGMGVQLELNPNETTEVTHTFASPGEYVYQCHVYCGGGHESMRGRIIVESP
jgi:cytochrome c oxidase subunit 2